MSDIGCTLALTATRTLLEYVKPHYPVRRLCVFLYIAEEEPVTLEDVSRRLGIPAGTAYDDLKALGKRDAAGKEGCRLIAELTGGPEAPAHRFILSPRGKRATERLAFQMQAAMLPEEDDEALADYRTAVRHTRG